MYVSLVKYDTLIVINPIYVFTHFFMTRLKRKITDVVILPSLKKKEVVILPHQFL